MQQKPIVIILFVYAFMNSKSGVGKTTLVKAICASLQESEYIIQGFYTEELRAGRSRNGFDIITLQGERSILAQKSDTVAPAIRNKGPKVGSYSVDIPSFEKLALPALKYEKANVIVVDEIGKMELFSHKFKAAIMKLFDEGDVTVLAAIPVTTGLPFVNNLRGRNDVKIVEVSKDNRNTIKESIIELVKQSIAS